MLVRMVLALSDAKLESRLEDRISLADVEVEGMSGFGDAWQRVVQSCADIIVISESLFPEPVDSGIGVLTALPERPGVVVIHDQDSAAIQAKCIAAGAHSALYSGTSEEHLLRALEATVEAKRQFTLLEWRDRRRKKQPEIADFVSASEVMQIFMGEVRQVAASDSLLLITGETGVGKEHLAKVIHAESSRSAGPFVAVNTAALPEQLLESELFGHKQGAFTGATRSRRGAFEQAHGGTIFLDEIGEMPLHLQTKLLRVLQDYEIRPVGAEKSSWVDVRVIAATNRNLEEAVANGIFRKDLFFRLSVVCLQIPPLRERREDIPHLARRFLNDFKLKIGRDVRHISEPVMAAMYEYDWPGNVRELMNVIERSTLLCRSAEIKLDDLPTVLQQARRNPSIGGGGGVRSTPLTDMSLKEVIEEAERGYLGKVLELNRGNIRETAARAGITTRSLYNKMRKFGLEKKDFKDGKEIFG